MSVGWPRPLLKLKASPTLKLKKIALSNRMVGIWGQRFIDKGLIGLYDGPKPRAPQRISDDEVAQLIRKTLKTKPKGETNWTCRWHGHRNQPVKIACSQSVECVKPQPHKQNHFILSKDPLCVEKIRHIAGLYLPPPDKAMVLCVDEKRQIQALD